MTRPVRPRVTTPRSSKVVEEQPDLTPSFVEVPDEEQGSRIEETPPKIPAPTISERVEGIRERARALPEKIRKSTGTKQTSPKRARTSVESLISTVWSIGARLVQPVAWPVANVLAMQSPVAGAILEDVVRNTVVDTVLQPIARIGKGGEVGFALLGPPILVGIACAKPESRPITEPLLRESLRSWLTVAGPKMVERAEKERQFQEEYGQTIDQMIQAIFTPPAGMTDAGTGEDI